MIRLCADEVPSPVAYQGFLRLKDSENSLKSGAPVAKGFCQGETFVTASKLNRNAAQLDLTGRYGGGGYGIAHGLELKAGNGLSLILEAGHAMIDGVVEVPEAREIPVPASKRRLYFWLLQDGHVWSSDDIEVSPSQACCFLGSCDTTESGVQGIDFSGVMRLRGGILWRETADRGVPGDHPGEGFAFFTKTRGGVYFWDGWQYLEMLPAGSPKWTKVQKNLSGMRGQEELEIELLELPEFSIVHGVCLGGFCSSHWISVGLQGSTEVFCRQIDLSEGRRSTHFLATPTFFEKGARVVARLSPRGTSFDPKNANLKVWILCSFLN
jgi:hypothetical protein